MRPHEIEYVNYRMARARESLDAARMLLEGNHPYDSVNRLYYACFYAVTSLLLIEGYSSPKHTGIIALFDRWWIRPRRLPETMGRFYRRLFESRHESDYGEAPPFPVREEMEEWYRDAEEFIGRIEEELEELRQAYE